MSPLHRLWYGCNAVSQADGKTDRQTDVGRVRFAVLAVLELPELDLVLELFKLIPTVPSKELEQVQLMARSLVWKFKARTDTHLFCKSPEE